MCEEFKYKDGDTGPDVVILRKTEPGMCGGTDATQDRSAPKEIKSQDMVLFDVSSKIGGNGVKIYENGETRKIGYVSAFAVPAGKNSFVLLETSGGSYRYDDGKIEIALLEGDVFPDLVRLAIETDLARNNGFHSTTHGLPENFGGSIDVRYRSGERIGVSNNQSPVLSSASAEKIIKLFEEKLAGKRVPLPSSDKIREIRFDEERKNGGFTKAVLTINSDGTAANSKKSRYDGPTEYESEKAVDVETVEAIRKNIDDCFMTAWAELPEREYKFGETKKLTFVFESGDEITVTDDRVLPGQISRGFFNIELELTTKH